MDFHVWDGIFQGSRSHLLGLYRCAVRQAPEIDFVFFLDGVESLRASYAEFSLPNVTLVRMRHRPGVVRLALQLPWLQWRHRIDLMHVQYRLPPMAVGPCACTIHDVLFESHPQFFEPRFVWQSRLTSRAAVRRAAVLLTVSHFSRAELARIYGIDPLKVGVTFNAVDKARFYPGEDGAATVRALGLEPGRYLLTVGRLEPRKNHLTLLEAYAQLQPAAPPLVIVGQRDFGYAPLFAAIHRHGLEARVRLIENASDADLPALMRNAQLFVYPAFAEGFGMPVLEALASGVPVITSNTTSLPEVAGSAAILVSPVSVEDVTSALKRVLADAALRASLGQAGVIQAAKFNWEGSAAVLLSSMRKFFALTADGHRA
ncbi:MAG: glycosyltransferase family 4 protein [Betaproteobacteria bacterium]|nr:glycosyltransferase family 4 protein [Betaproteobacteria bacterium]